MQEKEQRFWDIESRSWSDHRGLFGGAQRMIFEEIKEVTEPLLLNLSTGDKILNLGAGANNESFFGEQLSSEQLIAMDFSRGMLNLNEASMKIMADASLSIPLESESIDFCFSSFLMRYLSVDDQINLFAEIYRVLKKGNHFVIADLKQNNFPHQKSEFDAELLQTIAEGMGFSEVKIRQLDTSYDEKMGGFVAASYKINLGVISGIKI